MRGEVEYETGPMELTGDGNFSLASSGTFNGAQNLVLSGLGTKTFSGVVGGDTAVNPNGLGLGTGAAITMSGGTVTFGTLTTASGLSSTTADVVFTRTATLRAGNSGTSLNADVTLQGATIDSAGNVNLGNTSGDAIAITGDSILTGGGRFVVNGTANGNGSLLLSGAGIKTFSGSVGQTVALAGITQASGSGLVTFQNDVTINGTSQFLG